MSVGTAKNSEKKQECDSVFPNRLFFFEDVQAYCSKEKRVDNKPEHMDCLVSRWRNLSVIEDWQNVINGVVQREETTKSGINKEAEDGFVPAGVHDYLRIIVVHPSRVRHNEIRTYCDHGYPKSPECPLNDFG